MTDALTHIITSQAGSKRLDKLLNESLPDITRSRLKALIVAGHVSLILPDGTEDVLNTPSRTVKAGSRIKVQMPPAAPAEPEAQNIPLDIVYEDNDLVVVNKAPGMVVHPASGSPDGTLVNALLHHCKGSLSGIGGVARPGIVHRIDKDTSGLLVVAKNDQTHTGLSAQFAAHSVYRRYIAVCRGAPSPYAGRIEGAIARHTGDRKKMAVTDTGGKHAVTHYQTLESYTSGGKIFASLIECRLETGRTHQVRVHMAHIGNPLIGDPVYGNPGRLPNGVSTLARAGLDQFRRQALHARDLGFTHPISGEALQFSAELPSDMEALVAGCRAFLAEPPR